VGFSFAGALIHINSHSLLMPDVSGCLRLKSSVSLKNEAGFGTRSANHGQQHVHTTGRDRRRHPSPGVTQP
jgi:hypothetical protein